MRTKVCLALGITAALGLLSCNEDRIISNTQLVQSISVTGQDFQNGDAANGTRAAYTNDSLGIHFSWTAGDTVGIYPVGGDQVAFPISGGEGSQTAQFDGGTWALRSSYSYAAYYPFSSGNYDVDETSIPVSYLGQTQNSIDRYDYQASVATRPDGSGNVNIELMHLGSFACFQITMPVADTYKSVTLTSSKTPFVTSGTFDLTKEEIAISPKDSLPAIKIGLNNRATTNANKVLSVYVMIAPQDLSDSEINLLFEGQAFKSYTTTVSGKNMLAGKAYNYTASVHLGTNNNGEDVYWDLDGQEITIKLDRTDLNLLVGNSKQIKAILGNSTDTPVSADVVWTSSDESVASVSADGTVTALSEGVCTITATVGLVQSACKLVVSPNNNGYSYVDLGLSVNWATYNVGAEQPEEWGDFYAWGEIETYYEAGYIQKEDPLTHWKDGKSDGYWWSSYTWCNASYYLGTITKYNTNSKYGAVDNKTTLDLEDDVAHVKWGSDWRMPTNIEQQELCNNCTWTKVSQNGVNGFWGTSNIPGYTDRSVFLPAVIYLRLTENYHIHVPSYWSSSLATYDASLAYCLEWDAFSSYRPGINTNGCLRSDGYAVRPVFPSERYNVVSSIRLNKKEVYIIVGDNDSIIATPLNCGGKALPINVSWYSSDENIAKIAGDGKVTAVGSGTCTITATDGLIESICKVIVVEDENELYNELYDGHEYVDLGLSVKWATCNVGASKPEEYGDYFAWGETEPKTDYSWSTYKWCNGSEATFTKYCNMSMYGNEGFTDNRTVLDLEDDVAHIKWGGIWRIPTTSELNELISKCTWNWTNINGFNGYVINSNVDGYTDRSIFLPAAGGQSGTDLNKGSSCLYWSNSYVSGSPIWAYRLIKSSDNWWVSNANRNIGMPIRPVCP